MIVPSKVRVNMPQEIQQCWFELAKKEDRKVMVTFLLLRFEKERSRFFTFTDNLLQRSQLQYF